MSTAAGELLPFLLGERPPPLSGADIRAFLRDAEPLRARFLVPVEHAVAQGFVADRVGAAFAAGYGAALLRMVPGLDRNGVASFCVTEEGGNHPRSIATSIERKGAAFTVSGAKKWSTLGPVADVLILVARAGVSPDGRPELKAVQVPAAAFGLTVTTMAPTPFIPEVPHATLQLEGVIVDAGAVLPGDGYVDYTKAFRTLEDLHVNAALTGYLLSLSLRHGWPEGLTERLALLVLAASALGVARPEAPGTHVALAGLVSSLGALVSEAALCLEQLPTPERERWNRDQALLHVAGKAREQRRVRAWQTLRGTPE